MPGRQIVVPLLIPRAIKLDRSQLAMLYTHDVPGFDWILPIVLLLVIIVQISYHT